MASQFVTTLMLLVPLAAIITYYDVRYRRIPNKFVLATLVAGLTANAFLAGWRGIGASLAGCAIAFGLMLILHCFGALGAGDVKLFSAIGATIGVNLVLPTFLVVLITGGGIAILTMLRAGTVRETMDRVGYIFSSLLFSWTVPRLNLPEDKRQTVPYGVAIMLGSLISLSIFRA